MKRSLCTIDDISLLIPFLGLTGTVFMLLYFVDLCGTLHLNCRASGQLVKLKKQWSAKNVKWILDC